MKFILGTKVNMTQVFDDQGNAQAVTVVQAGPVVVTQVKTEANDGYSAVQVGFGAKKDKRAHKAQLGHIAKAKEKLADLKAPRTLKEFCLTAEEAQKMSVGDMVDVSAFAEGDTVRVVGVTKAKGFASVIKRHNFKGGPRSHGQKHCEKAPGSLGMAGVQRVFKGKRMAGRMGADSITVRNLKILKLDKETNTLYVRGALPGRRGTLLMIRTEK